eukprot:TRINITY_DN5625_c0_g1_i1.p1 TRINITY_DN5625_c0_g1~~TRINITY_DN5625_c0_g1_i1.p1  ORF type:complete len:160 (-),score=10.66 TRINITY_DN5625_c0_g1_i1:59-538(-)
MSSRIVKLNVGGVLFTTTSSTLTSHGENFFSGLLSGRFGDLKDENGAFFIDRNGEYFSHILEFLRTSELTVPQGVDKKLISREARFYSIESLYTMIDAELEEKFPAVRTDGFYSDASSHTSLAFLASGQLVCCMGGNHIDNIRVFCNVLTMPQICETEE